MSRGSPTVAALKESPSVSSLVDMVKSRLANVKSEVLICREGLCACAHIRPKKCDACVINAASHTPQ